METKKRGRPAKVKMPTSLKELPIGMCVKVNGNTIELKTTSVLTALHEIPLLAQSVKTMAVITFRYNGLEYKRIIRPMTFKAMLQQNMRKLFIAKAVNSVLGIPNPSYEL